VFRVKFLRWGGNRQPRRAGEGRGGRVFVVVGGWPKEGGGRGGVKGKSPMVLGGGLSSKREEKIGWGKGQKRKN